MGLGRDCLLFCPSRDRASLQLSNRRLERKVKELVMQVDDEHLSLTDQKDQVGDPLRILLRFNVGWGSQTEGRAQRMDKW